MRTWNTTPRPSRLRLSGCLTSATSATSERSKGMFSKITFLKSVHSSEKDELCPGFKVKILTKSVHRGGVFFKLAVRLRTSEASKNQDLCHYCRCTSKLFSIRITFRTYGTTLLTNFFEEFFEEFFDKCFDK